MDSSSVALALSTTLALLALFYPPFVIFLGRWLGRDWRRGTFDGRIAVVVAARDEEKTIIGKLANIREDFSIPSGTEIVVIADGCRDRTAELARSVPGVRVIEHPEPGGKARRFNEVVPGIDADVILFSDATARWAPGSAGELLAPLVDSEVGAVGAALLYGRYDSADMSPTSSMAGTTRRYFDLETRIRQAESRLSSTTGFSGSLYAVRKELIRPLAEDANEDFQSALDMAAQGRRAILTEARVWDEANGDARSELRMRRRVIARALRALIIRTDLLWKRPVVAAFLFFHKILRFFAWSFALVFIWGAAARFAGGAAPAAGVVLAIGGILIADALFSRRPMSGAELDPARRTPPAKRAVLWTMTGHFFLAQLAAMLAFFDVVTGRARTSWRPDRNMNEASR